MAYKLLHPPEEFVETVSIVLEIPSSVIKGLDEVATYEDDNRSHIAGVMLFREIARFYAYRDHN